MDRPIQTEYERVLYDFSLTFTELGHLLRCASDHIIRQERQHPSHEYESKKEAATVLTIDHTGQAARSTIPDQLVALGSRAAGFKNSSASGHAQMTDD